MRFSLILLSFCLCTVSALGQILDTSEAHYYKPKEINYFMASDLLLMEQGKEVVDTTLFQYEKSYWSFQEAVPFIDQGLEASPQLQLFGNLERDFGFQMMKTGTDFSFYDTDERIYTYKKPFTRLNYSQGNQELIFIEINHGQQIAERLFFGVDYRRLKNQNIYYSNQANQDRVRQNNLFNNRAYVSYQSLDRRYELVTSYVWNRNITAETGGMTNLLNYDTLEGRSRIQNNTGFLEEAFVTHAQNCFTLSQYYRPEKRKDSANLRNLDSFNFQFFAKTRLNNLRYEYEDREADSALYGVQLGSFHDSAHHRSLSQQVGFTLKTKFMTLAPYAEVSADRVDFNDSVTSFGLFSIGAQGTAQHNKIKLKADAKLGLLGYTAGNFLLNSKMRIPLGENLELESYIRSSAHSANYFDRTYLSAARQWQNDFDFVFTNGFGGSFFFDWRETTVSYGLHSNTVTNYIFHGNDSLPQQDSGSIALLRNTVAIESKWKFLNLKSQVHYQLTSDGAKLPLPQWSTSSSVWGEFMVFKKNLQMQIGASVYTMSDFNAPRYLGLTQQWLAEQNQFAYLPQFDAFVNARVKSLSFGIKLLHANAGLFGNAYYASPAYPRMPLNLRLNIQWDLMN